MNLMYRDQLEQKFLTIMNTQLKSGADFSGEVEMSIFSNFPSAAMHFGDFLVKDAFGKGDTLLYADDFAFVFDLRDLFKEQISVREMVISEGILHLVTKPNGDYNWDIWKDSEGSTNLSFEEASFESLKLMYFDQKTKNNLILENSSGTWNGKYRGEDYKANLEGQATLKELSNGGDIFLADRSVFLQAGVNGNLEDERYEFSKFDLDIERNEFKMSGWFDFDGEDTRMDLELLGDDLGLASFLNLLPEEQLYFLEDFEPYGQLNFQANIEGAWKKTEQPEINGHFSLDKGSLDWKKGRQEIDEIAFAGTIHKSANESMTDLQIDIPNITAEMNGHAIEQSLRIKGGEETKMEWQSSGVIDLLFFQDALEDMGITGLTGLITVEDLILSQTSSSDNKVKYDASGKVGVSGMEWEREGFPKTSVAFDGALLGDDLDIDKMTLATPNSLIQVSGSLGAYLPYLSHMMSQDSLSESPRVVVDLDLKSPMIDLEEWIPSLSDATDDENQEVEPGEAFDVSPFSGFVNLKVDKIKKGKAAVTDLWGELCWEGRDFIIEELLFHAFDGQGRFSANYHKDDKAEWKGQTQIRIAGLDLQRMLLEMEDFKQEQIKAENVSGLLTVNMLATANWDKKWRLKKQRLKMSADIELEEFKLMNFKPLMEMMDDKTDRLAEVEFLPLKNQIFIKDWQLQIPRMTIASNIVNIDMAAAHTLEDGLYYHFKVDLLDYLGKRFFNKNKNSKSVEKNDRGGLNYYFSVYGSSDKPRTEKSTKKKVEQRFRKDASVQKINLRELLQTQYDFRCN